MFIYLKNHVQVRVNDIPSSLSSYDASSDAPDAVVKPEKKEIISKCRKQVYYLKAQVNGESYSASGFLYNEYGDIVTNAHVVEGAAKIQVRLPDSQTEYEGVVIGIGKNSDIALVRVPELAGMKPLEIEKDKEVQLGDEVIALGSPLGYQNTATIGIISGLYRSFDLGHYRYEDVYQISAPISSGSSGGPLIDAETGKVLGINSAGYDVGSIGFSIPIYRCVETLDQWADDPVFPAGEKLEGEMLEDKAMELVDYLYKCLNEKDYVTAYLLWGFNWQAKTPYQTYKQGYSNTPAIMINDMKSRLRDEDTVEVELAIFAEEEQISNDPAISSYKVTYLVGYENGHLKILDGGGKKS